MSERSNELDGKGDRHFRRLDPNDQRAGYADGQIQKLRQRLLDLTNRNRLLNYVFADRVRGQVRVIDELPKQLFGRLQAGQGMWFRPLADPKGEPADEKSDKFVAALDAARFEDEDYLKAVHEIGAEDVENPIFLRVERELRDRVRTILGLPPRPSRKAISRADVAREQGLEPTYDLPIPSLDGVDEKKHDDNEIQTLLFSDEMERKLSFLRDQTRKGHEETGLNTLFAAYGFLEWYESEQSDKKLLAPLIMQPLDISREKKGHAYRYGVVGSGESSLVNLTLVERMKEFSLAIPEFEEGGSPDEYFARVAEAVSRFPRWRVRRYVVVGTFSFGKLAMWHDLDPAKWPPAKGLSTHPVVAGLMSGTGQPAGDDAEPYNVDTEEVEKRLPLLVTDADASQLCTILDAMEGKDLAVKGPPGTGKSQTITNLIAAAIGSGKRVLFVAEKMAALEVVKNRLDHFGLGDFILELHSTKARKEKILSAIRSRIELPKAGAPAQLAGAQDEVRRLKRQLGAYVELLNTAVGRTGKTLQEVLWAENRTREVQLPPSLDRVVLENAGNLTAQDWDRCRSLMRRLERAREEAIGPSQDLATHPWLGVRNLVPVFQHDSLIATVRALRAATVRAQECCERFVGWVNASAPLSPEEVIALAGQAGQVPRSRDLSVDSTSKGLLGLFADPEAEVVARALDARWESESNFLAAYERAFGGGVPSSPDIARLRDLVQQLNACRGEESTIVQLRSRLGHVRAFIRRWEDVSAGVARFATLAGVPEVTNAADVLLLKRAAELASGASVSVLRARRVDLVDDDGPRILNEIRSRAEALKYQAAELSKELKLDAKLSSLEIRRAAGVLRDSSVFSRLFSPKFNTARCLYEDLSHRGKVNWKLAAQQLDAMADYLEASAAFDGDPRNAQRLGDLYKGVDTDFTIFEEALRFGLAARELGRQGGCGRALRRFLLEAAPQDIVDFAEDYAGSASRLVEECVGLLDDTPGGTINDALEQLGSSASRIEAALVLAEATALREGFPIEQLPDLVAILERYASGIGEAVPDEMGFASKLSLLGFDRNARELRRRVLDLAAQLRVPNGFDAGVWRSRVFSERLGESIDNLHQSAEQVREASATFDEAWREFDTFVAFDCQAALTVSRPTLLPYPVILEWVDQALSGSDLLPGWIEWLRCLADVRDEGLMAVVDAYVGESTLFNLDVAFDRVFWRSLVQRAFASHEELARFSGVKQEEARRRFRELDKRILELNREQIRATLSAVRAPSGTQSGARSEWTDMALLGHHSSLQRPRISIRKLIAGAHGALQCIKPCWMMSPGSIAQFLPQGLVEFDLVVIDEASQLKPEDAVGATARGQQIVVVGDPMQLPPTSFFDRVDDFAEDDDGDVEAESVLDLALSVYRPARNLRWHYRSRHESLVAFSNKEFYEGGLIVFPSPHDATEELGVKYRFVEGRYQGRGGNQDEVKAISEAALRHMRLDPARSLGVVAVNKEQSELIRREIERMVLDDEDAQDYLAHWEDTLESFFVKNLETVQGDERDVIMISMVYGPNEKGVTFQRFGPINSNVGHRRLNVLFTRAKYRVEVFTSMTSADVQPGDTSKWGVSALKRYLEYAATGRLESGDEGGGDPDSDFEVFVADALRRHGFEVRTQVGVAGFRIDLGVRHAEFPHGYVLGIECDGASYHSAKSARDRDALRQEILEQLGWRLYRIWSTDWFNNPRAETEKLVRHLNSILETRAELTVSQQS